MPHWKDPNVAQESLEQFYLSHVASRADLRRKVWVAMQGDVETREEVLDWYLSLLSPLALAEWSEGLPAAPDAPPEPKEPVADVDFDGGADD